MNNKPPGIAAHVVTILGMVLMIPGLIGLACYELGNKLIEWGDEL